MLDDRIHQAAVVTERVRPAHRGENPIAGVLERQVEVRRETAAACGDELDDLRRAVHRLERTYPEREVDPGGVERVYQVQQRSGRGKIATVRSEVHAGQDDFLETRGGDTLDFLDHRVERHAAAPPPSCRNEAVRTALLTAGLYP